MDANGILAVTAQDTVTGAKAGAEIKAKDGRLSADEIDKMVQDAEKHRAQDDELADKVTTASFLRERFRFRRSPSKYVPSDLDLHVSLVYYAFANLAVS